MTYLEFKEDVEKNIREKKEIVRIYSVSERYGIEVTTKFEKETQISNEKSYLMAKIFLVDKVTKAYIRVSICDANTEKDGQKVLDIIDVYLENILQKNAFQKAKLEYEYENGSGSWDESNTYERENCIFAAFEQAREDFWRKQSEEKEASLYVKHTIRINFTWDDGDDMQEFIITTRKGITDEDIKRELIDTHKLLDEEEDYYGINGRNPESLVSSVCETNGWSWCGMEYDVDINLD